MLIKRRGIHRICRSVNCVHWKHIVCSVNDSNFHTHSVATQDCKFANQALVSENCTTVVPATHVQVSFVLTWNGSQLHVAYPSLTVSSPLFHVPQESEIDFSRIATCAWVPPFSQSEWCVSSTQICVPKFLFTLLRSRKLLVSLSAWAQNLLVSHTPWKLVCAQSKQHSKCSLVTQKDLTRVMLCFHCCTEFVHKNPKILPRWAACLGQIHLQTCKMCDDLFPKKALCPARLLSDHSKKTEQLNFWALWSLPLSERSVENHVWHNGPHDRHCSELQWNTSPWKRSKPLNKCARSHALPPTRVTAPPQQVGLTGLNYALCFCSLDSREVATQ